MAEFTPIYVAALSVAGALLYWQFFGFPALMSVISRRGTNWEDGDLPPVTVIVPAYNEGSSIEPRIHNLFEQDYPPDLLDVIVVESRSTDETRERAEALTERYPNLEVIHQNRREGKASAINLGTSKARGDILIVTDANTIFAQGSIRALMAPFNDPSVGGAGGWFVPRNTGATESSGPSLFWDVERLLRTGEQVLDSSVSMSGEISAWRRGLAEVDASSLAEDLDLAVRIRKQGYRIAFVPDALAYEAVPYRAADMVTQWRRTSLGAIQCTFHHLRFLLFHPSWYTYLIYPSHKILEITTPFLIVLGAFGVLATLWAGAVSTVFYVLIVLLLLSVASMAPILRGLRRTSTKRSSGRARFRGWVLTFLSFQWSVLLAWKDFIRRNLDVRWQKIEATR